MKKKTYKTNGLIYSMLMAWTFSLWLNQGTWDLAFWKIPSLERVFLIEPGHLGPGSSWARTLGTRFLGMYPVAIYFLSEPGHLGADS